MTKHSVSLSQCMDIFDWFDDPLGEYVNHILLSKLDGEARVLRALPTLVEHAEALISAHIGTKAEYPRDFWNQPA